MTHSAISDFWDCYDALPAKVRALADRNFELLKQNPAHPSLHYKTIGAYRSVRVGIHYRALGIIEGDDVIWFWIGTHADYDRLIKG